MEGKNNNWDFDALISMYDFVQLTPEIPEKTGWAFTKEVKDPGTRMPVPLLWL